MSGSRRGRLAAASYTGLALSVLSALAVPALASALGTDGGHPATPHFNAAGLLPFGPPATMAILPAAADAAPAPTPAPAPSATS